METFWKEFEIYAEKNNCEITFDNKTGEELLLCKGVILRYSEWVLRHCELQ